jgi:hypothetical protein
MNTEQPAQDPSDGYVQVPGSKLRTRIMPGPSAEDIAHPYVLEHCAQGHTVRLDIAPDEMPYGPLPGHAACQQCGGRIVHIRDSRGYHLLFPDPKTPPDSDKEAAR